MEGAQVNVHPAAGELPPELEAVLAGAVTNFARAKVQGEVELKKSRDGEQTREAAAGHYDDALSQLAGLLSHLPADQGEEMKARIELVRGKMKTELGVASASLDQAEPTPVEPPLEIKAELPQESVAENDSQLVPDEGLAELYRATENGGRLGETLKTGCRVFVLRENASPPGSHLAFHFEARGGAFAANALVTFDDDVADVCFEDGAEMEGLALDRLAPRTKTFEPSAASSDSAVAHHRQRADAAAASGKLLLACAELVEALRWLDLAEGRNEERSAVLTALGSLHLKAGRADAAASAAKEAARIAPSVAVTLLQVRVATAQGDTEGARRGKEEARAAMQALRKASPS